MKTNTEDGIGTIILEDKLLGPPDTYTLGDEINNFLNRKIFHIILDFEKVEWISSMGVGTLVRNLKTVKSFGGDLYLVNLSRKASHVLSVTQLLQFFNIHNSIEDAIKSIKK
jgi:anti-sigma B factor antagonist